MTSVLDSWLQRKVGSSIQRQEGQSCQFRNKGLGLTRTFVLLFHCHLQSKMQIETERRFVRTR
jgi:hypothetical protein